jgi:hypothetical protein
MKNNIKFASVILLIFSINFASAAHFIVGIANDARDGSSSDGKTVTLWNPANGINDNLTDIVGPTGNSGSSNIYLIDCELLNTPCQIGDEIRVKLADVGAYTSNYVNLTVTGAGFDVMSNITPNSPPQFISIQVEDSLISPLGEIDLTPFSTTLVNCSGIIREYDGDSSLSNLSSEFFNSEVSSYGGADDNNYHYTNSSCFLNTTYGSSTESSFSCNYIVQYYANSGNWNCTSIVYDNSSTNSLASNITSINTLLALSVNSPVNFGFSNDSTVSQERTINITNAGNSMINLSLSGYANSLGDNLSMSCVGLNAGNISIFYTKYNLTSSNSGELTLSQFENLYLNLSSSPTVKKFNLNRRQNDASPYLDDTNYSYWRIYSPPGVSGTCTGNIVFGATQSTGD